MSELALPAFMSKPWVDGLVIYTNFFLARYVAADIGLLCGNIFDSPGFKTLTLWMVIFGATRNIRLTTLFTVSLLSLNLMMARVSKCGPYVEKDQTEYIGSGFWVSSLGDSAQRMIR